jgi:hypothetical protein
LAGYQFPTRSIRSMSGSRHISLCPRPPARLSAPHVAKFDLGRFAGTSVAFPPRAWRSEERHFGERRANCRMCSLLGDLKAARVIASYLAI